MEREKDKEWVTWFIRGDAFKIMEKGKLQLDLCEKVGTRNQKAVI